MILEFEAGLPADAREQVRQVVAAGLVLLDLVEPEWPERNTEEWGGWSPLRGRLLPGTAILVTEKPA